MSYVLYLDEQRCALLDLKDRYCRVVLQSFNQGAKLPFQGFAPGLCPEAACVMVLANSIQFTP